MKSYIFPGQGAQFVGLGKNLYNTNALARKFFDTADEILNNGFLQVCFEGPIEKLTDTTYCQPALFVHSMASFIAHGCDKEITNEDICFGLSLGELTAMCVAGVFDFETGVRIVSKRGRLMQDACESTTGAMLAIIGGETAAIHKLCKDADVEISNINCPGQTVISGENGKIDHALDIAKSLGFKRAIKLNVAGAYHSKLMKAASEKFEKFIENIEFHPPKYGVLSNVTGDFVSDPGEIKKILVKQIYSTVLFQKCVETAIAKGANEFLECGAGTILGGLVTKVNNSVEIKHFE